MKFNRRSFLKKTSLTANLLFFTNILFGKDIIKKKDRNDYDSINIKSFGATGNSTNDTDAFRKAVALINTENIGALYIPSGVYLVDPSVIILKKSCKIYGDGKSSVLKPVDINNAKATSNTSCIEIQTNSCIIEDVQIRDYRIGITWSKQQQVHINRCHIYQNTIGIICNDAYLNNITNNYITFNNIGIISYGRSFQLLINSNIIDNNSATSIGGIGILLSGSNGCEIRMNSIEGNRNQRTGTGCGIYISGVCVKLNIIGNWFETNFETKKPSSNKSIDIYCADKESNSQQDILINDLVLNEYKKLCSTSTYGSINIRDNFYLATAYSIYFSYFRQGILNISGNIFSGSMEFFNKPIYLINNKSFYNSVINITENQEQNTAGDSKTLNYRMLSGINNSLLFMEGNNKKGIKILYNNEVVI